MEKRIPTQYEVAVASQLAVVGILAVSLLNFTFQQKKQIREQQHNICADCHEQTKKLEVHHRVPKALNGADRLENAIGLCGSEVNDCHNAWDEAAFNEHIIYPGIPLDQAPKTLFKNP